MRLKQHLAKGLVLVQPSGGCEFDHHLPIGIREDLLIK